MTEPLSRLTAALADRYTIERELGAGGIATVYLAEDLKLHRKVAVGRCLRCPRMLHGLARIYVVVGQYDLALEQLETFVNMPSRLTQLPLRLDPLFDPIRSHPRFEAPLAKRMDP